MIRSDGIFVLDDPLKLEASKANGVKVAAESEKYAKVISVADLVANNTYYRMLYGDILKYAKEKDILATDGNWYMVYFQRSNRPKKENDTVLITFYIHEFYYDAEGSLKAKYSCGDDAAFSCSKNELNRYISVAAWRAGWDQFREEYIETAAHSRALND